MQVMERLYARVRHIIAMTQGIQMLNAAWNQLGYGLCKPVRVLLRDYKTPVKTPTGLLSRDYSKMIEYFSLNLQCTTAIILWATAYYI